MRYVLLVFVLSLALGGCATEAQTRAAVTGGAVGAVAGATMAGDGDQAVTGALVGGAIGAATAAILSEPYGARGYGGDDGYGWEGYSHGRRYHRWHGGDGEDD